jgi:Putative Ig domain/PQQ-like domain
MMHKMIVSAIVAALIGGYVAMLYAFVRVVVLINHSYLPVGRKRLKMKAFRTLVITLLAAGGLLLAFSGAWAWQAKITAGWASVVAVDGAGNVVAAGGTHNAAAGTDFTVAKFDGASGQELWRRVISGVAGSSSYAVGLAVDGAGNVAVAGNTYNAGTGSDFTVIKFDGTTGAELWRKLIANGSAEAVVVDAAGNVVAAGYTSHNFTVVKFEGVSGAELWRKDIHGNGTDGYYNQANAVAVDAAGNVVAAGMTGNTETGPDFTVVKLSGMNGAEFWRQIIYGTDYYLCYDDYFCAEAANAVAVDAAGNVVAAGSINNLTSHLDFTVVKFDGASGVELWRKEANGPHNLGDEALAVVVDAAGNVVAAGGSIVIKYSGVDGAEHKFINGGAVYVSAVIEDALGDVVVAGNGNYNTGTFSDFTVIKFSGVNGAELWRQVLNGTANGPDWAGALALDMAGNVVVAGSIDRDFTVVKLTGPQPPPPLPPPSSLAIGATTLAAGEVGVSFTGDLLISGGVGPYVVSITKGKLPAGLSLGNDGIISGTPSPTAKSATITVRITDSLNDSVAQTFTITVLKAVGIAGKPKTGRLGRDYSSSFKTRGGLGPFNWSITAGVLPAGLSFNTATGVITGIPAQAGEFPLTVQVTDALGGVDVEILTLKIR